MELGIAYVETEAGWTIFTSEPLRKINDELINRWFPIDKVEFSALEKSVIYSDVFPAVAVAPSLAQRVLESPMACEIMLNQLLQRWK